MAKKKADVNKSAEIRTYMDNHPKAKPRDVVAALKTKGVDVSAQFVSTVKANSKKGVGTGRRGRPSGSGKKASVVPAAAKRRDQVSVQSLLKLKSVIKEIGSIEETKAALATLEKLAE